MKTAISIPDDLFIKADQLAHKLKQPRSRLYAAAMDNYLKKYAGVKVTQELDEIYSQHDSSLDPALVKLQNQSLPKDRW